MQQSVAVNSCFECDTRSQAVSQLSVLAEVFPSGVLATDAEGRIIFANARLREMFGYADEELLGEPIELLVPEEMRKNHVEHRNELITHPRTLAMGKNLCPRGRRKDGSEIFLEVGLQPIATAEGLVVLAAIADVTERKQAEEQTRYVMEAAPSGVILVDEQCRMVLVNGETERMFGFSRGELIGQPVTMILPDACDDASRRLRKQSADSCAVRDTRHGLELTGRRKDGTQFPLEMSLRQADSGSGSFLLGSMVDVSDRKQAEEYLRKAKEAAEVATRAKSEFLSAMSHELRTPLNAIIGFSQGLINRSGQDPLSEGQKDRIEKIHRSGIHLLTLINDILDIATVESGKVDLTPTTFDVREVLSDIRDMVVGLAREKPNLDIRLDAPANLPPLNTDREKVKQILVNLAGNAVKFTDQGSVTLTARRKDNRFVLSVVDTGVGIPEDEFELIFEKFLQGRRTAKQAADGSGLGLTISRRFAELLGGRLTVSSTVGEGSTFSLVLPEEFPKQPG
jgi:protein-histidine pros-kinase